MGFLSGLGYFAGGVSKGHEQQTRLMMEQEEQRRREEEYQWKMKERRDSEQFARTWNDTNSRVGTQAPIGYTQSDETAGPEPVRGLYTPEMRDQAVMGSAAQLGIDPAKVMGLRSSQLQLEDAERKGASDRSARTVFKERREALGDPVKMAEFIKKGIPGYNSNQGEFADGRHIVIDGENAYLTDPTTGVIARHSILELMKTHGPQLMDTALRARLMMESPEHYERYTKMNQEDQRTYATLLSARASMQDANTRASVAPSQIEENLAKAKTLAAQGRLFDADVGFTEARTRALRAAGVQAAEAQKIVGRVNEASAALEDAYASKDEKLIKTAERQYNLAVRNFRTAQGKPALLTSKGDRPGTKHRVEITDPRTGNKTIIEREGEPPTASPLGEYDGAAAALSGLAQRPQRQTRAVDEAALGLEANLRAAQAEVQATGGSLTRNRNPAAYAAALERLRDAETDLTQYRSDRRERGGGLTRATEAEIENRRRAIGLAD